MTWGERHLAAVMIHLHLSSQASIQFYAVNAVQPIVFIQTFIQRHDNARSFVKRVVAGASLLAYYLLAAYFPKVGRR
jgi:hypothetical protein